MSITSALYAFLDFPQVTTTFSPMAIMPFLTALFFTHEVVPFDHPSLHLTRIFSISADLTDSQTAGTHSKAETRKFIEPRLELANYSKHARGARLPSANQVTV